MKSFGFDFSDDPVPVPVGERCLHCGEPIAAADTGFITPYIDRSGGCAARAFHRECMLRNVLGSVGHQRKKCSCYGGTEEDPPGMTKREAARAAVRLFMGNPN